VLQNTIDGRDRIVQPRDGAVNRLARGRSKTLELLYGFRRQLEIQIDGISYFVRERFAALARTARKTLLLLRLEMN